MKKIIFCGSSEKNISAFPMTAKVRIARLLDMLVDDVPLSPKDFKYFPTIGMGTYELRVKTDKNFRVFYVTKYEDAVYILHAFTKKTQKTLKKDIDSGISRYKAIVNRQRRKDND